MFVEKYTVSSNDTTQINQLWYSHAYVTYQHKVDHPFPLHSYFFMYEHEYKLPWKNLTMRRMFGIRSSEFFLSPFYVRNVAIGSTKTKFLSKPLNHITTWQSD